MPLNPEELSSLCKSDPLAFAITHVDLLDGKSWSINDRKWIIEPYAALNPAVIEKGPLGKARRVVIEKSTQAGISTLSLAKALHFMAYWSVRVMYMLPRQKDLSDFSATRFDPIIKNSPFLKSIKGNPDSVYTKKIGNSYMFFLEGSVEPRSMPADSLFLDEYDLCNPIHAATAINRLDASPWKMVTYLSTPTLPAAGIDALYHASDMRRWVVPCPHCGAKQQLDWDLNLRVIGSQVSPEKVYYACVKCEKEITLQNIQEGAWVAEKPALSGDMIGYHISQMMTTTAWDLYKLFRDPDTRLAEFYRKRLGKPYTLTGGSIERDDFYVNCFDEEYDMDSVYDGESTYYMAVDQGNQLQVIVGKIEKNRRRKKIVHIELIPFDVGFKRVAQLIQVYHVKRCLIDGEPNRHPVRDLQIQFPSRVLLTDYIETQKVQYRALKDGKQKILSRVYINRTMGFDALADAIKRGEFLLPGTPSRIHPMVDLLIDHCTAIRRDIEKRRTSGGEVEVAVWRNLRADHFAHCMLYLNIAVEVDNGNNFKVKQIGASAGDAEDEVSAAQTPDQEMIINITILLAEVPHAQLKEFMAAKGAAYEIPFPLSYKLAKACNKFDDTDIMFVINSILRSELSI
jgi:hypothetical protein